MSCNARFAPAESPPTMMLLGLMLRVLMRWEYAALASFSCAGYFAAGAREYSSEMMEMGKEAVSSFLYRSKN